MGHHYNPARVMIIPPSPSSYPHYELIFANTDSGEQVRMYVPRHGMFEDPAQEITMDQVEELAEQLGEFLSSLSGDSFSSAAEAKTKKRRSKKG
jgi:hypothetical protein